MDIKQSTAITVLFFAFDANGDAVTGIADGSWTKKISKNGGTFSTMTVTITERESGWYAMPLSTSHTDTLGFMSIYLTASGAKQVNMIFQVTARLLDNLAYPATSGRSLDVDTSGRVQADLALWRGTQPNTLQTGRVDGYTGAMATDVISSAALSAAAIDEIWDEVIEGTTTARQSFRLANSVLGGKTSGSGTSTLYFRDLADSKNRLTVTVSSNNRTAVTRDLT